MGNALKADCEMNLAVAQVPKANVDWFWQEISVSKVTSRKKHEVERANGVHTGTGCAQPLCTQGYILRIESNAFVEIERVTVVVVPPALRRESESDCVVLTVFATHPTGTSSQGSSTLA